MATREGIYVGGHEIIERYVGSKLVWQKWRFLKRFSNTGYAKFYEYSNDTVVVSGGSDILANQTFNSGDRKLKIINHSDYGTEVFYAKQTYVYGMHSGQSNYQQEKDLYIKFNSNKEASDFKQRYHSGTIDIYI